MYSCIYGWIYHTSHYQLLAVDRHTKEILRLWSPFTEVEECARSLSNFKRQKGEDDPKNLLGYRAPNGETLSVGVPQNGWSILENPVKKLMI